MSMLAEPRSRQKWSDDPRNTRWSSDKSKFGYQMLEKMGWSEGSGLGQTLQGTTSHVKIKKKKNSHGIGMKSSHDDDWIAHQDSFNALLSQLNSGDPANAKAKKIQSLEDRVRVTRTKIMYSRFVKSKDLSRASSNDLACIFGQRSKSAPATPQRSEDEDDGLSDGSTASCPTNKKTTEHGFTTISSGVSVADYFAKKMAALKQGKSPSIEEPTPEPTSTEVEKKKKKKKKEKLKVAFDDIIEVSGDSEEVESDESDKKKKKKKKRDKANDDDVITVSDEGESDEPVVVEKKKKKNKKSRVEDAEEEEGDEVKCDVKKKKKKKKDNKVEDDDDSVVICEKKEYSRDRIEKENESDTIDLTTATTSPKKKSKKKKHESDELNNDDDNNVTLENQSTSSAKKSKKKKRKQEQIDNDDETTNITSGEERKKKRKKRHQSDDEDEKE